MLDEKKNLRENFRCRGTIELGNCLTIVFQSPALILSNQKSEKKKKS
jgi:hypothetical protein